MRTLTALAPAAIVFLTLGPALAQVPAPADMKSCNEKAKSELETASASPRTEIERPYVEPPKPEPPRGELAKGDAPAGPPPINPPAPSPRPADQEGAAASGATGTVSGVADPQLEGMDAEAGKDPAYRAAYKACMRQSGF